MNKTLTNFLRSAFAVVCLLGALTSNAKTEVIAAGGATTDDFSCTIGETFVGATAGLWADVVDITTGIDGIYSDGDVIVGNVAAAGELNIQLPDELVANGVYYNVYTLSGMLLEKGQIETTTYVLNYSNLLTGSYIIVTINTPNGVIATYKLSK